MHIKHIHCMIEDLAEYGKCMIEAGTGEGKVNLCDAGQIVDMIKDLADAEYHSLISKEMKKYEEEEEEEEKYLLRMLKEEHKDDYKRMREEYGEEEGERRFYDNYRHADGRFARKGTGMYMPRSSGRRRGYVEPPYYHMMSEDYDEAERMRDIDRKDGNRMYFTEPMHHASDMNRTGSMRDMKPESRVERARRGYTETKMTDDGTPEHKKKAMESLDHYMRELADDMTELVSNMDNSEKTMLKSKLQGLIQKVQ